MKMNLADPTPEGLRNFVVAVTGLACADYNAGKSQNSRSGKEIVAMFCSEWRGFHCNLASTIYNKVILSFESAKNEG